MKEKYLVYVFSLLNTEQKDLLLTYSEVLLRDPPRAPAFLPEVV